jgi:hypothetical protein
MTSVPFQVGAGIFSPGHHVQTGSGAHSAPSLMGVLGVLFPEVKWAGCKVDHSPPSSAEIKNAWRSGHKADHSPLVSKLIMCGTIPPLPSMSSLCGA